MNILNFSKATAPDLARIVNEVKELETKIKQLKHKREMLVDGLELYLDSNHLYDKNKELIATKIPYFMDSFSASNFKKEDPDRHKSYMVRKEVSGRWKWL